MQLQLLLNYGLSAYVLILLSMKVLTREFHPFDRYILQHFLFFLLPLIFPSYLMTLVAIFNCWSAYDRLIRGGTVNLKETQDMTDKVVIITGSNTGVGFQTAAQLMELGAHVILACRSRERAEKARQELLSISKGKVTFLPLDLCRLQSVRDFVDEFHKLKLPLHLLINNAGVIRPQREVTSDEIEMTMAANHFGHFLLTNLLLEDLKPGSRIVNLASCVHMHVHSNFCHDLMLEKSYSAFQAYNQSKLANMLFTRQLVKETKGKDILVFSVHPGLVLTSIGDGMTKLAQFQIVKMLLQLFLKTTAQGAYTSVFAATDSSLKQHNGAYLLDCRIGTASALAQDDAMAQELWEKSMSIVRL